MSWVELLPEVELKPGTSPVSVSINKTDGRFKQRMIVTVRVSAIGEAAAWCKPGAPVRVQCGRDEDAGCYRLTSGGPFRFRNSSGHIKAASVSLPAPVGAPREGCRQVALRFECNDGILWFSLPEWGRRAAAKAPYLGICERVPDPAKAVQAANGARVR